jgi:hypothetical protein
MLIKTRRVDRGFRAGLAAAMLAMLGLLQGCANLARVSDESIPKLLTPLVEADLKTLLSRVEPLTTLQAFRSSRVLIQFLDAESAEKWRNADAVLVLQRPDRIRLIIQVPVTKTKVAEMVSEANRFRVAIYYPERYRRFLVGTNDADYSRWREKLGREGRSALVDARPFHFTEALLARPLHADDPRFTYTLEEALVEEADTRPGAKKGARLVRSFYVIAELEAGSNGTRVRRRFWFDRTAPELRLARQQIFDLRGLLETEVSYADYQRLTDQTTYPWPALITVTRPHDGYAARLTFSEGRFEINPTDLPEAAFTLDNSDNLPVTDLDQPVPEGGL